MKRLIALLFLCLAPACQDGTPVKPDLNGSSLPGIAAKGEAQTLEPGFVPLKGDGTWEWDGIILPPGERCLSAGGLAEVHFTGAMHLTHLGLTVSEYFGPSGYPCYNPTARHEIRPRGYATAGHQ